MKKEVNTPVKKVVAKKVSKKVTKKVVARTSKVKATKISMTLSQAKTIQKALGSKSYKFLDTKVSAAHVGSIIL